MYVLVFLCASGVCLVVAVSICGRVYIPTFAAGLLGLLSSGWPSICSSELLSIHASETVAGDGYLHG